MARLHVPSRFLRLVPICMVVLLLSHPWVVRPQPNDAALRRQEAFQISALSAGVGLDIDALPPFVGGAYVPPPVTKLSCGPPPCVLPNVAASAGPRAANETPVVVNPRNPRQLLASANDWNCGGQSLQRIYTSDDGGSTWTRNCVNSPSTALLGGGDPAVGYDLQGNAYIAGLEGSYNGGLVVVFEKSSDNGKSWSTPQVAVPSMFTGGSTDKDWLQIDTNPKSPFANALYISVGQFDAIGKDSQISVSHSDDGGQTWTLVAVGGPVVAPTVVDPTALAIGDDGTVYLAWMQCTPSQETQSCGGTTALLKFSKSTDGGNTWSKPRTILRAAQAPASCRNFTLGGDLPNTCERVIDIPVLAIDHSDGPNKGNLYVAYFDWTGTFMKLYVATSTDGGGTWARKAVAPASINHDQFFPWVNVSPEGMVGVSWLDRRNDPANKKYEAFAAFSNDGGKSFGKNIDLSAAPSDPANDGFGGRFMGDYTGNAWAGNKTFYVTFTDTTTGVGQDFIGGYRFK